MTENRDAVASTHELAEQVRVVSRATRDLADRPGDLSWVLGGLAQANRRLMQVYAQVANAHLAAAGAAPAEVIARQDAAAALRRAVRLVERLDGELDVASRASSRIASPHAMHDEALADLDLDLDLGVGVAPDVQALGA